MRLSIALLLALFAAGCDREKPETPQAAGTGEAASSEAVLQAGKPDRSRAGQAAPDLSFLDPDGEPVSLAAFEGKPLLVNLWATWCAPCVAEMPTLDALAGRSGDLQVIAVSEDFAEQAPKVAEFFAERKLANLEPYRDPELGLMTGLGASTLPTTVLYDAEGREVWRVIGALDWSGAEAAKLIAEAL